MAALSTEHLEYVLTHILVKQDGHVDFLGVFPADCLPISSRIARVRNRDACFVANTDPHGKRGAHWLAFYYDCRKRRLEYFDSYGLPISMYPYVHHNLASTNVEIVPVASQFATLQALDSNVCSYYCVLFLYFWCRFCCNIRAMGKMQKLGSTAQKRDAAVVIAMQKLVRQNKCNNAPSSLACTRFSQLSYARSNLIKQ